EGPEIFERSAAAADDDDVDVAERVEVAQPLRDLLGGAVALHAGGRDHDVQLAEAAADHAPHVADRRAARRRHHADLSREARQLRAVGAQTGTGRRRMDEARPVSGSSAITTPWRDAGPRAVSKRIGIWLRKRWMIWSRSTPMTPSVGPVRPRSVM